MSTWHQQQNPVPLWHPTQWTVVTDPPGECMTVQRTDDKEQAYALAETRPHSYVLRPGT